MSAPTVRSLAARVSLLERAALKEHERIMDLQKAVINLGADRDALLGALKEAFGYAGVPYPEPRHLHAVRDR